MYYKMEDYSQIIHDILEKLEDEIDCFEPTIALTALENTQVLSEFISPIGYEISNILEIINPKLKKDIEALTIMQETIEQLL